MPSIPYMSHPATEEILASAARTATATSDSFPNHDSPGVLLSLIVTAIAATPGLTPKIQYTPDNGTNWIDYCVFTAIAPGGAANYSLMVHPWLLASADGALTESFQLPLPRLWRLVVTAADTDSATYSVRAMYL